ncbi:MAG: hypothetical protein RLZZ67_261 [Candidatus Parcubacteria bacterium]
MLATVLAFSLLVIGLLFFLYTSKAQRIHSDAELDIFAEGVLSLCGASGSSTQACYDTEIPKIMNQGVSLEQAFDVVRLVQKQNDTYWFCHAAAHKISANEYYKDPAQWRSIMTRCPVGICSNGCLHGALQERFSKASLSGVEIHDLLPDLKDICEKREGWNPTNQEKSSCYHEIGHLSMYLADANVVESAKVCDALAQRPDGRDYRETCYEGIFMQVFEPREPDDFGLIYKLIPKKDAISVCEQYEAGVQKGACWKAGWQGVYKNFCDTFSDTVRTACFREAWVIESEGSLRTTEGVIDYCSYALDTGEKKKCFNKLFYGLMASYQFDTDKMKKLCLELPLDIKAQCFANTASRLIETDRLLIERAVAICDYAAERGVGEVCYKEMSYYAGFLYAPESKDFTKLCMLLPTQWQTKCLTNSN